MEINTFQMKIVFLIFNHMGKYMFNLSKFLLNIHVYVINYLNMWEHDWGIFYVIFSLL